MLSPPDADLVAREPDLPGLATLLDGEAFLEALRPRAPGVSFGPPHVTYLRYKPETLCLVAFRIAADGRPIDVYGIAHRPDAATKLRNAREKREVAGPIGVGRFVLDDQALVVSFFPNDRRLRILPALPNPKSRGRLLRKVLPDDEELWNADVETIRYRPERRYSAKLVRDGRPRAVLKLYGPEDFGPAARAAKAVHSRPPMRVPRRLGKSTGRRLLVFEWMEGRLLEEALADPGVDDGEFARSGRALAAFHGQEAQDLPLRTRRSEAAALQRVAADLGALWPPLAKRARDLTRHVTGQILDGPEALAPIHGDFQAEHVLLSDEEVRIVDLDEVAWGDPTIDLGNFLAHLELDAVRGIVDPSRVDSYRDAFLEGYDRITQERANVATAQGLLRLAVEPFRDRDPNWPETMGTILERAEGLLQLRADVEARS